MTSSFIPINNYNGTCINCKHNMISIGSIDVKSGKITCDKCPLISSKITTTTERFNCFHCHNITNKNAVFSVNVVQSEFIFHKECHEANERIEILTKKLESTESNSESNKESIKNELAVLIERREKTRKELDELVSEFVLLKRIRLSTRILGRESPLDIKLKETIAKVKSIITEQVIAENNAASLKKVPQILKDKLLELKINLALAREEIRIVMMERDNAKNYEIKMESRLEQLDDTLLEFKIY